MEDSTTSLPPPVSTEESSLETSTSLPPPETTEEISLEAIEMAKLQAEFDHRSELIKKFVAEANRVEVKSSAVRCLAWIRLGKMCNKHCIMARKLGIKWSVWLNANIPSYSRRTIEDYRKQARVKKVEQYVFLGKKRLMYLIAKIDEDDESLDPIGDLLKEMGIKFDPTDAIPEELFKEELDITMQMRALIAAGITGVNRENLRNLITKNTPLNARHIKQLVEFKTSHGDVNEYLSALYLNDGTVTQGIQTRISHKHFNEMAQRIDDIIDEKSSMNDFLDEVDETIVTKLVDRLDTLLVLKVARKAAV